MSDAMRKFKFVFVPADSNEPMQDKELVTTEDKEVESLLDHLKDYFQRTGPQRSPEQMARQRAQLLVNIPDAQREKLDERTLMAAMEMQMVENIALLTNAPEHDFVGVNMYVDDAGASKALPLNARASNIGTTCGKPIEVRGDAFLARVLDDGDRFRRLDLTTAEMSSSASWVRSAFAQNERKRRAEAPEVTLQRLQQTDSGASKASSSTRIKELPPAEAAKEDGNTSFAGGRYEEALEHYSRALQLDPELTAAQNNRAMCLLRLGQHSEAEAECTAVVAREPRNVKALLRRGTAREALDRREDALADFEAALQIQPANKEAAAKVQAYIQSLENVDESK